MRFSIERIYSLLELYVLLKQNAYANNISSKEDIGNEKTWEIENTLFGSFTTIPIVGETLCDWKAKAWGSTNVIEWDQSFKIIVLPMLITQIIFEIKYAHLIFIITYPRKGRGWKRNLVKLQWRICLLSSLNRVA